MEEKQETKSFHGVMVGLMTDEAGAHFIGVTLGTGMVALTPGMGMLLFDQIGDILDALGMLDDPDEVDGEAGVQKCH